MQSLHGDGDGSGLGHIEVARACESAAGNDAVATGVSEARSQRFAVGEDNAPRCIESRDDPPKRIKGVVKHRIPQKRVGRELDYESGTNEA